MNVHDRKIARVDGIKRCTIEGELWEIEVGGIGKGFSERCKAG